MEQQELKNGKEVCMGKINSKDKGKRFELEIAHYFQEHGYPNARRSQQFCGINGDADVVGVPNIHIECKHNETLNIFNAMEQARRDAKDDEMPVVIHKKNRTPILVTMDIDVFNTLLSTYNKINF